MYYKIVCKAGLSFAWGAWKGLHYKLSQMEEKEIAQYWY